MHRLLEYSINLRVELPFSSCIVEHLCLANVAIIVLGDVQEMAWDQLLYLTNRFRFEA